MKDIKYVSLPASPMNYPGGAIGCYCDRLCSMILSLEPQDRRRKSRTGGQIPDSVLSCSVTPSSSLITYIRRFALCLMFYSQHKTVEAAYEKALNKIPKYN
jgi:hypothetical protein